MDFEFLTSDIMIEENGCVSFLIGNNSYEIHKTQDTMPKNVEYVEISKAAYNKRYGELYRKKE